MTHQVANIAGEVAGTGERAAVAKLAQQLAEAEAEINARVYKLFHLTPDEIKLLEREVEH